MKKPWSISTTARNPERIFNFLDTLKSMEGEKFNSEAQIKFQTLLIRDKHYRPTNMNDVQNKYFETEKEMPYDVAREIFFNQKYMDPAMRGRQSFAILKKMGLCIGSTNSIIQITGLGNAFLSKDNDMGDLFFNYFLKWQLPNNIEPKFKESDGFMIVPFLGTLHLIQEVNRLCSNKNKKPIGISKKEFALFIPTLIHHDNITSQAEKIIEYRLGSDNEKSSYERQFLEDFLGTKDSEKIKKLSSNLKDYGDNIIRYFRFTRYIRIRGNGHYVDLEPRRMIEISELLSVYRAMPRNMINTNDYIQYLSDKQQPRLPWKEQETLERINNYLQNEITEIKESLDKSQIKIPEIPEHTEQDMDMQNNILKSHLLELQNIQKYYDMDDPDRITKCIGILSNIRRAENKPSIELEKQIALSLMALNDALKIKPNYPVGDDGEPTFTAPGGVSDLECYYEKFNMICEVTMLSNSMQWVNEGQPVMRHLREFEDLNDDKSSYCIFIAPKIHIDTANTFWIAVKHEYRGRSQKIIPLKIDQFVHLLEILKKYKGKNNKQMSHVDMLDLYDRIVNLVNTVESSDAWIAQIPTEIRNWEKCLLN